MPHAGPLPDVAVLGPYTYLATEVAFGAVALALLYRADALRTAARTIAVLYPIAYLWDWYTLHVGVFAIELRTGVDLLGIPIEEHVFVVVVPAFVLGIHETLRGSGWLLDDEPDPAAAHTADGTDADAADFDAADADTTDSDATDADTANAKTADSDTTDASTA